MQIKVVILPLLTCLALVGLYFFGQYLGHPQSGFLILAGALFGLSVWTCLGKRHRTEVAEINVTSTAMKSSS